MNGIFGSGASREPYKSLGCARTRPKFCKRHLLLPDPVLSNSTFFLYKVEFVYLLNVEWKNDITFSKIDNVEEL